MGGFISGIMPQQRDFLVKFKLFNSRNTNNRDVMNLIILTKFASAQEIF